MTAAVEVVTPTPRRLTQVRWSLLLGNFVIGCGVMVAVGTLNDITRALAIDVHVGGRLIAIGAIVVCLGAPLLAGWVAGFDRRRLLAASLAWYAAGHALCALMPTLGALWPVRAATMLGAAVFTPQAAAAIGFISPPAGRGSSITFIFLGWSLASVLGMPMAAFLGESFGWRVAFLTVSAMSVVAAISVYRALPDGIRPAALTWHDWKRVLTHPMLMAMVFVTALSGAGQFTLLSYFAPYYKTTLHTTTAQLALLFMWFGAFGVVGNAIVSRWIDRIGANRAVALTIAAMLSSLLLWPLATSFVAMALVLVPWGLGCFASNSAQQARLGNAAPAVASALLALNTSAIYLGQAAGSSSGGWLIAHFGYTPLSWLGATWVALALALSLWVGTRQIGRENG